MKRLRLLIACLLACAAGSPARAAERPSVVVVLVDDFGWADPSCYGNAMAKTPNMDRLAREGVRFTQGYVASPICSPSRCGIITGQFPARWKITSFLQTKAGNWPVMMPHREGEQIGDATYPCVNRTPSLASRSMFGVFAIALP